MPSGRAPQPARRQVVDQSAGFLQSLPDRPVAPGESPAQVRALLGDRPLPEGGAPAAEQLREAAELLFDHSVFNSHPRFWGSITASPAPIGILADLLPADFGAARYDACLLGQITDSLTPAQNCDLFRRVHTALRPGGTLVIDVPVTGARASEWTQMDASFTCSACPACPDRPFGWGVPSSRGTKRPAGQVTAFKETAMPTKIPLVTVEFNVSEAEYRRVVFPLPSAMLDAPGLRWKIWLTDADRSVAGRHLLVRP